jgi:hypothetical protein
MVLQLRPTRPGINTAAQASQGNTAIRGIALSILGRGNGRIKGQLRDCGQWTSGTSGSFGALIDQTQGSMRFVVPTITITANGFAIRITLIDWPAAFL